MIWRRQRLKKRWRGDIKAWTNVECNELFQHETEISDREEDYAMADVINRNGEYVKEKYY